MQSLRAAPLLLLAALAGGCAVKPEFLRAPYSPPRTVAVLPFGNMSNSVEAPVFMQKLMADALQKGGYAVQPLADTTTKLRAIGITQGGQEKSKTPVQLAAALGVDAIVYGDVRSFSYMTVAVYQKREVGVHAELFSAAGERLWAQTTVARRQDVNLKATESLGEFAKSMGTQLAVKLLEKIVSHPLYPEMLRCIHDLTMTLPSASNPKRPVGRSFPRGYDDFFRDLGAGG